MSTFSLWIIPIDEFVGHWISYPIASYKIYINNFHMMKSCKASWVDMMDKLFLINRPKILRKNCILYFLQKKIYKFLKAIFKKYSLISEVMVLAISQNQPSNSMNSVWFEISTAAFGIWNIKWQKYTEWLPPINGRDKFQVTIWIK